MKKKVYIVFLISVLLVVSLYAAWSKPPETFAGLDYTTKFGDKNFAPSKKEKIDYKATQSYLLDKDWTAEFDPCTTKGNCTVTSTKDDTPLAVPSKTQRIWVSPPKK